MFQIQVVDISGIYIYEMYRFSVKQMVFDKIDKIRFELQVEVLG
jgi:hypothetical protein